MINFPYDAARRQAEKNHLAVISICHADLPEGIPAQDHYGNWLKAQTVYFGKEGTPEKRCAYGRSVMTIHQQVDADIASALADIAESLLVVSEFADAHAYEDYYRAGCRHASQMEAMNRAWWDHKKTADRAIQCLPAEMLEWLRAVVASLP